MKKVLWILLGCCVLCGCSKKEQKVECPNGKINEDGFCVVIETSNPRKVCEEGYTLQEGEFCTKVETISATSTLTCPKGFVQVGSSCYSGTSSKAILSYRCPATQREYNKYIEKTPTSGFMSAKLSGSKCIYTFCEKYIDGRCVDTVKWTKKAISEPGCKEGTYKVGDVCRKKVTGSISYSCPQDYEQINTKQCRGVSKIDATIVCDSGAYNEETKMCEKVFESK